MILTRRAMIRALRDPAVGLAVTPLLEKDQIGRASIDLRLGPDLIIIKRETGVVAFDPARADEMPTRVSQYQAYVRRPLGSAFHLHPGDFAIARSLEYLALPDHLAAQAGGRSSWGRLGLVIATATLVQPRFRGTITLELANIGTVPLVLYVGMRVAQVSFFVATSDPWRPPGFGLREAEVERDEVDWGDPACEYEAVASHDGGRSDNRPVAQGGPGTADLRPDSGFPDAAV